MQKARPLYVIAAGAWNFIVLQEGSYCFCELGAFYRPARFGDLVGCGAGNGFFLFGLVVAGEELFSFGEGELVFMGKAFA